MSKLFLLCFLFVSSCLSADELQNKDWVGQLERMGGVIECKLKDWFGKNIDGIMVSDFVYPSWFESFRKSNSTKFNF